MIGEEEQYDAFRDKVYPYLSFFMESVSAAAHAEEGPSQQKMSMASTFYQEAASGIMRSSLVALLKLSDDKKANRELMELMISRMAERVRECASSEGTI